MKLLSHVRLFATPWTAAYQAPPSMGFSRQEYWSGVPLPSLYCHHSFTFFSGNCIVCRPFKLLLSLSDSHFLNYIDIDIDIFACAESSLL